MRWKFLLLLPLFLASFCLFSCAVKSVPELTHNETIEKSGPSDDKVNTNVNEIPTALDGPTIIGYPSLPQGFSADKYALGEKYVDGYPGRPKILLAPTAEEVTLLIKN